MSLRKHRKSAKNKPDNRQRKDDLARYQSDASDNGSFMRDLLLEQVKNKTNGTPQEGAVKADADDPFETNPTLRAILGAFCAKASDSCSSDEAGCKSTSDCEDYKKSIRQEVKPVPGSNEPERINTSKEHSAFRNAQPRQSESGDDKGALLVEMLIARKRHLASKSRTLRRHNSAGRSRRASEVEFDPLSNVALRRVMPEFLAAEKQGRVKVIGPPARVGGHYISPTRTLKLVLATFLEKSAVFHMPYPGLHIEGVPDEYDRGPLSPWQAGRASGGIAVRGFGSITYQRDSTES